MTPKSEKDAKSTNKKKTVKKTVQPKPSSRATKKLEEDDFDFNEEDMETPKSSKKSAFPKSTKKITDDDEEDEEIEDDWTKVDEVDSSWDPDFEEFDIPKSKNKNKASGFAKKRKRREEDDDEDDDFSIDDDFKDLNNDSLDEEDDLY